MIGTTLITTSTWNIFKAITLFYSYVQLKRFNSVPKNFNLVTKTCNLVQKNFNLLPKKFNLLPQKIKVSG